MKTRVALDPLPRLREGVKISAKLARIGYGSAGGHILIQRRGDIIVSKSTRVALCEASPKDPVVRMGLEICRDVATKMQIAHGCGAGTAVLLLDSLLDFRIRRGRFPSPYQVPTTIPDWGDIASLVRPDLVEEVQACGDHGSVVVKKGKKLGTEFLRPKAIQVPLYLTERKQSEDGGFTLDGPLVCVVAFPLTKEEEVRPLMECGSQWFPHPFLIVAPFIAGKALETIQINRVKGGHPFYCLSSKEFHADRSWALEDVAAVSGARIIHREFPLDMVDGEFFGFLAKVEAGAHDSMIYVAEDREHLIDEHIARLEYALSNDSLAGRSTWQSDRLRRRIAAMDGGLLEIRVCEGTDEATKWAISRIEDEVALIRSASKGVVKGVREWLNTLNPEWWECCPWWKEIPLQRTDPSLMWQDALTYALSGAEMIINIKVALCQN